MLRAHHFTKKPMHKLHIKFNACRAVPCIHSHTMSHLFNQFTEKAMAATAEKRTLKQHKTWLQEDMAEAMLRSNITEEHAAKKIISQHPYQRLRSRHRGRAAQLQQVRRGDILCQFLQQDSPASLLDPRCTNQTRQSRPQMEWRTLIC